MWYIRGGCSVFMQVWRKKLENGEAVEKLLIWLLIDLTLKVTKYENKQCSFYELIKLMLLFFFAEDTYQQ